MFVLLHGFGSTADSSTTICNLKSLLPSDDVIAVSYNYTDPHMTFKQIETVVNNLNPNDELTFVGISLGGFWARYFANKYSGSKLIMINPSIDAPTNVNKYIGQQHHDTILDHTFGEQLQPYFIDHDRPDLDISVIVGLNDDVVDPQHTINMYTNRARVYSFNGGHRPSLNQIEQPIIEIVNLYCE